MYGCENKERDGDEGGWVHMLKRNVSWNKVEEEQNKRSGSKGFLCEGT